MIWILVRMSRRGRPLHAAETDEQRLARLKDQLPDVSQALGYDDLPEDQKALRLRFANVKSKVCRPIAQ